MFLPITIRVSTLKQIQFSNVNRKYVLAEYTCTESVSVHSARRLKYPNSYLVLAEGKVLFLLCRELFLPSI